MTTGLFVFPSVRCKRAVKVLDSRSDCWVSSVGTNWMGRVGIRQKQKVRTIKTTNEDEEVQDGEEDEDG